MGKDFLTQANAKDKAKKTQMSETVSQYINGNNDANSFRALRKNKSKRVGIRLTEDEYKMLLNQVQKEGCTCTEYIVKLIKSNENK